MGRDAETTEREPDYEAVPWPVCRTDGYNIEPLNEIARRVVTGDTLKSAFRPGSAEAVALHVRFGRKWDRSEAELAHGGCVWICVRPDGPGSAVIWMAPMGAPIAPLGYMKVG